MDANRRILLSLAVIAASTAATAFAWRLRPPPPPPPAASNVPVFSFAPAEVASIRVQAGTRRLEARRAGAGWEVSHVEGATVSGDGGPRPPREEIDAVVSSFVRDVVGLPVIDRFPRGETPLADFGLAEPRATIKFGLVGGTTRRLEVGSTTIAANAMYARSAPPDDVIEIGTLLLGAIDAVTWRLRGLSQDAQPGGAPGGGPG
ncbi:MAG: hypothetical protein ACKOCT_16325 [Alphaproteobacteria bacterium]